MWSPVGKGLTSWLPCMGCFLRFCHLPIPYRVLGHVLYLIVWIADLCLLLYFAHGQYAVPPVRLKPATPLSPLKHSTTGYFTRIVCGDYGESFRLLLWPWSKRSESNISYKCWQEFLFIFVRGCPYIPKWFLKVGTLKWRFQSTNTALWSNVKVFRIGPTARNMYLCILW